MSTHKIALSSTLRRLDKTFYFIKIIRENHDKHDYEILIQQMTQKKFQFDTRNDRSLHENIHLHIY